MTGVGRARKDRTPRVRKRLQVSVNQTRSFSVDVSRGGLCLELSRVLPPGTQVTGTIQTPGKAVPFTGSVVWARPGDPYLSLRGRMGILFTAIAADALLPLGAVT